MILDTSKSIILWCQGQSNMVGGAGNWGSISSTGLYAPYAAARNTIIDPKLIASDLLTYAPAWTSDFDGDLYEFNNGYGSHTIPNTNSCNMMYSFAIELMAYLNGIGYTKNVYMLNHALGGTSLREISGDFDWANDREIFFESSFRLKQAIEFEQDANGNDSQVFAFWHQGEADQSEYATQLARLENLYDRQKSVIGFDHQLFLGQLVPQNPDRIAMNSVFFDFKNANSNVHIVGQDLAGGVSTWEKMEADDPDGVIDAAISGTYTYAADNTHYDWPAQILQGLQLWDLFTLKILT